jgi:hypothetical protein
VLHTRLEANVGQRFSENSGWRSQRVLRVQHGQNEVSYRISARNGSAHMLAIEGS